MGIPVVKTMDIAREGQSLLGSITAGLITAIRQILQLMLDLVQRFVNWAGEHPLATTLLFINFTIWVS